MLATAEKVNLVGFDGPDPERVIFWINDGKQVAKTICYDNEDFQNAMAHKAGRYESYEVVKNAQ
ncbi:hypothetical protein [Paenilisteria newyorkensis]|uniref:hypothetical protein n=1 Tax=Listeria newyorkensis TaxID=1497681 RepID=UPI000669DCBB|nr:hypothetical protein [Listeria newyorkensis]KMT62687.1 hypothetical protein X559_0970 [Listeria newyorkensis]